MKRNLATLALDHFELCSLQFTLDLNALHASIISYLHCTYYREIYDNTNDNTDLTQSCTHSFIANNPGIRWTW